MFHTKICGVKRAADIEAVSASGADAIGLNFYEPSVRFVDPNSRLAEELSAQAKSAGLLRVGLFVNEPVDSILKHAARLGIDAIQLHGDEDMSVVAELQQQTSIPILRAIKLPTGSLTVEMIEEKVGPWEQLSCQLLLDADAGAAHGGSGKELDWSAIRRWAQKHPAVRWALAGGLTPENIALAVQKSHAKSVDVASGVEMSRGEKSDRLILKFVQRRKKAAN